MTSVLFTGGGVERWVHDVERLLKEFRTYSGYRYVTHQPATPRDRLVVEDVGVTLLLSSRVTDRAVSSIVARAGDLSLAELPDVPLQDTSAQQREAVAALITNVANWPGFGAATATKLLHKKRPALIPVLDNLAIFGAYLSPTWGPDSPAYTTTVKDHGQIKLALDWIHQDLTSPRNASSWAPLQELEPNHTRIEIFDTIWWMYFRKIQPVSAAV